MIGSEMNDSKLNSSKNVLYPGMEHFANVLYLGFHAERNLCDKQNVLFYGRPRSLCWIDSLQLAAIKFLLKNFCTSEWKQSSWNHLASILIWHSIQSPNYFLFCAFRAIESMVGNRSALILSLKELQIRLWQAHTMHAHFFKRNNSAL